MRRPQDFETRRCEAITMNNGHTVELPKATLLGLVLVCLLGCFALGQKAFELVSGGGNKEILLRLEHVSARLDAIERKIDGQSDAIAKQEARLVRVEVLQTQTQSAVK
jgi:hypothetical protein